MSFDSQLHRSEGIRWVAGPTRSLGWTFSAGLAIRYSCPGSSRSSGCCDDDVGIHFFFHLFCWLQFPTGPSIIEFPWGLHVCVRVWVFVVCCECANPILPPFGEKGNRWDAGKDFVIIGGYITLHKYRIPGSSPRGHWASWLWYVAWDRKIITAMRCLQCLRQV